MALFQICPLTGKDAHKRNCVNCKFAIRKRIMLVPECYKCELAAGHIPREKLPKYLIPTDKQCQKCNQIGTGREPPYYMTGECNYAKKTT